MPAARKNQTNGKFTGMIILSALVLVSLTIAIISYTKYEKEKTRADTAEADLNELATRKQINNKTSLIGAKKATSYLGTMLDDFDQTVLAITGGPLEKTSAETKMTSLNNRISETIDLVTEDPNVIESIDHNNTGLIRIAELLTANLKAKAQQTTSLQTQLANLHNDFEVHKKEAFEMEQELLVQKAEHEKHVEEIKGLYDQLKSVNSKTVQERIKDITDRRDTIAEERDNLENELLKTQAQLDSTRNRLEKIQKQLENIMPSPSMDVAALNPDALVILVDNQVVHLNIGSDDRVYRGLTFPIYNKGMPPPKDGRGKAEVEVFDVSKNVSIARITRSQLKQPIVIGDIAANLIWDSDRTNLFVVAGQFDLDGDGNIEYDGVQKIESLIAKWGGKTAENITIDTDFVVLGRPPRALKRPTLDELELDPTATEKFEASKTKSDYYDRIKNQAQTLCIPVFNTDRFLYFIGYKTIAARPDAF
jgi:Tfp pilus assembly protein PilE